MSRENFEANLNILQNLGICVDPETRRDGRTHLSPFILSYGLSLSLPSLSSYFLSSISHGDRRDAEEMTDNEHDRPVAMVSTQEAGVASPLVRRGRDRRPR